MATAGRGVVITTGHKGVLSSGKAAIFDAEGECSECCEGECPSEAFCDESCSSPYYADVGCEQGVSTMNLELACWWWELSGGWFVADMFCSSGGWDLGVYPVGGGDVICLFLKPVTPCPDGIYWLFHAWDGCCEEWVVVY